jgi:RNA polymerase sigma-70 factor (ECF subfamily)
LDEHDLETVVRQHYPRLRRAALLMTGNPYDADELAQETVVHALGGWRRFRRKSRPDTWLFAILVNLNRKRLRAEERRWRRWKLWFWRRESQAIEPRPDKQLLQEEWIQSLWSQVAKLPTAQREAVVLRYAEGLSPEEIAQILKCPVGTAKSRVHHGILALRRAMADATETQHVRATSSLDNSR